MTKPVLKRVDNVAKSAEDKREYRALELGNHMKILLISDSTTDKSAAALNVSVGQLSDPDDLPGLAHFCEHMLFLGTEKYPDENDYVKFLNEHGGTYNAFTDADCTIYFFDVIAAHLQGALDRLAQFFIAPLFTTSATERELNAVNSEYEMCTSDDYWRLHQIKKHMCSKTSHPYKKFGIGSRLTLETQPKQNGVDVRKQLLKFHDSWYSSNIMSLSVLGKESLDELEDVVVRLFTHVKDLNIKAPVWTQHPFKLKQSGTITYIVPIKDMKSLDLVFPIPDMLEYYKSTPQHYLSSLLNQEGRGSLLSALKTRGWGDASSAFSETAARGFGFFTITVEMTEKGTLHTNEIIQLVFQYLNMLRKEGPLEWFQNELQNIATMNFRFKDKENPVGCVLESAPNLLKYPLEEVLTAPSLISEWNPDMVKNLLDDFVPENVSVFVSAKEFAKEVDQKEPWFGTEYKLISVPKDVMEAWKKCGLCDEFRMPDVNSFIPTSFELYPIEENPADHPVIIQDTALTRLWFKQDETFLLPKADIFFSIVNPIVYLDPINYNLTHMFAKLLRDSLTEELYPASLAGLDWRFSEDTNGLSLTIDGYNDKQHLLLEKIVKKLTDFQVIPQRFAVFKEEYIRILKNFATHQPFEQAPCYLDVLLHGTNWTEAEQLASMPYVTIKKLEAFVPQILSKMHIECLVHGNVTKEQALKLMEIAQRYLTAEAVPLLPQQLFLPKELKLEDGCSYLYTVENKFNKGSGVYLYYQCGLQNTKHNMLLELFVQIIGEPCYDVLRTKEQLGYVVLSGDRRSNGVQGVYITVQSVKDPSFVEEKIEEFVQGILKYLDEMDEVIFEKHKAALAACRLEKPKQMSSQSNKYWTEIQNQEYNFSRAKVEVKFLKTVTKSSVIKFYQKLFKKDGVQRRKIAIHVLSMAEDGAGTKTNAKERIKSSAKIIKNVSAFKKNHGTYPQVPPYIDIPQKGKECEIRLENLI